MELWYSDVKVPIPDVLPIDRYGNCVICVDVSSWVTTTLWRELVSPADTLTKLLIVLTVSEENPTIVEAELTLLKSASKMSDLSDPATWSASLNLWVPIPAAVVPNPTVLDLTRTELLVSFSKFRESTPEFKLEVIVPIKFDEKLGWIALSTYASVKYESVPSWVT